MRLILACLILSTFAGCLSDGATQEAEAQQPAVPEDALRPAVVVADIGPGANLYHEAHHRPWTEHPCARIPDLPCDLPALNLTLGDDYDANLAADAELWSNYTLDQPYWIPGTNLIVMSGRLNPTQTPGHGHSFHGSATTGAVNDACSDCYILVYQDGQSLDGEPVRRIAEDLPWVDFVVSTNWPGNDQRTQEFFLEGPYADATRALWDSGRLFFGASGNTPVTAVTPVPYHHIMLPPWVVLVGGAHSQCFATELNAGKPAEFVGNYTQHLPAAEHVSERQWTLGTSFSAPATAGMFAQALLDVRVSANTSDNQTGLWSGQAMNSTELEDGVLTHEELRGAMARAGQWFTPQEFVPCPTTSLYAGAIPASATPWLEMGWGYIGHDQANAAAQHILGNEPLAQRPLEANTYMAGLQDARAAAYSW